ncbi:unnamed protein product [Nippostrongylus brasiliensis]|uniref:Uncharacterized protein n=1 Tax=Nippostrongylus brasiliensis TaxID=27835 RepID=A0A0N4XHH8_NIPBR|nr:unnamed protein product [Nippostrongylus brasiliensis]
MRRQLNALTRRVALPLATTPPHSDYGMQWATNYPYRSHHRRPAPATAAATAEATAGKEFVLPSAVVMGYGFCWDDFPTDYAKNYDFNVT